MTALSSPEGSAAGKAAVILSALFVPLGLWLGFPNDVLVCPPLVLLCPLGLALLGKLCRSGATALLLGFLAGTIGHAAALYWLALPMSVVGGLSLPLSSVLAFLVAALLATQCGLFCLLSHFFWKEESISSSCALGLAWFLLEYAYAYGIGFPWLPLSGALAVWPVLVQPACLVGAGLTGGLWTAGILLSAASFRGGGARTLLPGLFIFACLTGFGVFSVLQTPATDRPAGENAFPVLMTEGNIDQNQKWNEAFRKATADTYIGLSRKAIEKAGTRISSEEKAKGLIIWPETAMPFDLEKSPYADDIRGFAEKSGMPLLTGEIGVVSAGIQGERVYNRAQLILKNGVYGGSYDKEHLVPFGEYVPTILQWDLLSGLLQDVGAYTAGNGSGPLRTDNLAIGTLICYEGIFPWLAQARTAEGANVLVDISNDGWFGDTPAPRQHMYLTALRALEQNRWLVRGTNTGISCVVDPLGRIVFRGPQFTADALWARAATITKPSVYHRVSPFIPPLCLLLMAVLFWRQIRMNRKYASVK